MKINGGSHATSAITNVLDVQTSYIPSPNNNFAISIYENPFVLTKNDNSVILITYNSYPTITDTESNFSPINVAGNSIINDDLVNYDYILNNINQRNNIVFSDVLRMIIFISGSILTINYLEIEGHNQF